ncbi:MAG: glycerophosphodiester phosphodiesterase [Gemmatimonadetes bacterium]|nr:glycerophosphodiester phosphodiesterase [Gemmatimonadota bacterium]
MLLSLSEYPVIAHRGNSAHAPEDTLESLRQGLALGADAAEFDVRLTRDGHVVLHHDPAVDRTSDGRGEVRAKSLAELSALDFGYRFTRDGGATYPWRGRGIRIVTLEDVLETFPFERFVLEVKSPEASAETLRLLARHNARQRCIVGSFDLAALAPFRAAGFATGAAREEVVRLLLRSALPGVVRQVPFQALLITPNFRGLPLPVVRFARMVRAAGVPTNVWTVDDPRQAQRLWAGGVQGILSNDPAAILRAAGRDPAPMPGGGATA